MSRLPTPGQDNGTWGSILNDYLAQAHTSDGGLKPGSVGASQVQDNALPKSKLDTAVQASLTKADSALQTAPVTSVAGKTGAVTLQESDIPTLAASLGAKVSKDGAVVNVLDYGAVGDNATNNDAAFAAAYTAAGYHGTIIIPSGTYKLTVSANFRSRSVIGAGQDKTILVQYTASEPVCAVGGVEVHYSDFTVRHIDRTALAQTVPAGIGMSVVNLGYGSTIERIEAFNNSSNIYSYEYQAVQGTGPVLTDNTCFSATFRDLSLNTFSHSAIFIRGSSTGNVFHNIYICNWDSQGAGTYLTATYGIRLGGASAHQSFEQVNIEHGNYSIGFSVVNTRMCVVDSLHFEGFAPTGSGSAFISIFQDAGMIIRGLSVTGCRFDNTLIVGSTALFRLTDNSHYVVRGVKCSAQIYHTYATDTIRRVVAGVSTMTAGAGLQLDDYEDSDVNVSFAGSLIDPSYAAATNIPFWRGSAIIDASTGALVSSQLSPRGATGTRPSASTLGAGAMFYDTTLSKPIWSDGTNWRDASGTIV